MPLSLKKSQARSSVDSYLNILEFNGEVSAEILDFVILNAAYPKIGVEALEIVGMVIKRGCGHKIIVSSLHMDY